MSNTQTVFNMKFIVKDQQINFTDTFIKKVIDCAAKSFDIILKNGFSEPKINLEKLPKIIEADGNSYEIKISDCTMENDIPSIKIAISKHSKLD